MRSVVGAPAFSGRRMTHLHRAGMDGKILVTLFEGPPCWQGFARNCFPSRLSGSMRSPVGGFVLLVVAKSIFAMSSAICNQQCS